MGRNSDNTICFIGEKPLTYALFGYANSRRYHNDIEHADKLFPDDFRGVDRLIATDLGFKACAKCAALSHQEGGGDAPGDSQAVD